MKEHSIVIGSAASLSPNAGNKVCWNAKESEFRSNAVDGRNRGISGVATQRQKMHRHCKITPLDTLMMEHGEPSSSSTLSQAQEQEELQGLVRKSMDLTVDKSGFLKPRSYKDKQHPQRMLTPYSEDVLEMHESIQSMMSFSVSDLVEEERGWSGPEVQQDTKHDKGLQESIESILSVSYSKLMDQQERMEANTSKVYVNPVYAKSSSTLTTAAMTKSFRDESQEIESIQPDNSTSESRCYQECSKGITTKPHATSFKTPSTSRQPFRACNAKLFSVPQNIFSPRGMFVSPLAMDPSPGHSKMSMHMELLNQFPKTRSVTGRSSSTEEESIESEPAQRPSLVPKRIAVAPNRGSRYVSASLFESRTAPENRTGMDSFGSFDFVSDDLGDTEEEDETLTDEDIFIVDNSIAQGSTESISVGSLTSSINRLSHFSPIGRQDMATFTWKRNPCLSPSSKSIPHRQRSADNVLTKEVNPRTNARIVHRNRSADNVISSMSRATGQHTNPKEFSRDEQPRPPTPVKRRSKLRSKRIEPCTKGRNVSVGDHRKPPVKQRQLSDLKLPLQKEAGSDISSASNCRDADSDSFVQKKLHVDQKHEPKQHRHRCHHPRLVDQHGDLHPNQRLRSKSRQRSRSRNARRQSSRRSLMM